MLRPGSAGSFTAADHIDVLDAAIAQLPAAWRGDLLVTVDGGARAVGRIHDRGILGDQLRQSGALGQSDYRDQSRVGDLLPRTG